MHSTTCAHQLLMRFGRLDACVEQTEHEKTGIT